MRRTFILAIVLQLLLAQAAMADMGRVSKPADVATDGATSSTTQAPQAQSTKGK